MVILSIIKEDYHTTGKVKVKYGTEKNKIKWVYLASNIFFLNPPIEESNDYIAEGNASILLLALNCPQLSCLVAETSFHTNISL